MRYIRYALFVAVVWLLLSGHYTALIMSLGVVSVLTVVWFIPSTFDAASVEPSRATARKTRMSPHSNIWAPSGRDGLQIRRAVPHQGGYQKS